MKVEKVINEKVAFEDIVCGDPFEYKGKVYMKTAGDLDEYNAVELVNGQQYGIDDGKIVKWIEGKFVYQGEA